MKYGNYLQLHTLVSQRKFRFVEDKIPMGTMINMKL